MVWIFEQVISHVV